MPHYNESGNKRIFFHTAIRFILNPLLCLTATTLRENTKTPVLGHAKARPWLALGSGMLSGVSGYLVEAKLQCSANYSYFITMCSPVKSQTNTPASGHGLDGN